MDVDRYLMIEKGLRGGMPVITHTKAEANNQYKKSYDPEKPSKCITYLDANSLFPFAMNQYLSYRGFTWVNPYEFILENVLQILILDTFQKLTHTYPRELHDFPNESPYCCEHRTLTNDMLSPYAKYIAEKHGLTSRKSSRLVTSLNDKTQYVIHEVNLKQAVDAGLKLTEIHRVIRFNQIPWTREFIEFKINKRKESKMNLNRFLRNNV